jgi:hypothetical protein
MGAWSPLRPIAESPRSLLRAPLAPGILDAPAPRAGAFVLAGAPGALSGDFRRANDTARFSELRLRNASEDGEFRRPLDVADPSVIQVTGQGWAPFGRTGVAIGRFVIDRQTEDVSSFTGRVAPYVSAPSIMTDSVRPPMRRTRARLEGALGVRVYGFGLGLAAAIDSREHSTVDFPLRRSGRASTPAATVGAERALPWYGIRIGAYHRWSEPNESNILSARPLPTLMYSVQGYDEPFGLPVNASTPNVFTRNDRFAKATGGTAEATLLGAHFVVTHESSKRSDRQNLAPFTESPPVDTWAAEGSETRVQVQRDFGARIRATVVGSDEAFNGSGRRADLDGIAFRGYDARRAIEGDVRVSIGSSMRGAVLAGVVETTHELRDFVAQLRSSAVSRTPFVSAELARGFGRFAVAAGVSSAAAVPVSGRIPVTDERGELYKRVTAPDLAYQVTEARAMGIWVTATAVLRGTTFIATLRSENSSPRTVAGHRLQPEGERSARSFAIGVRR